MATQISTRHCSPCPVRRHAGVRRAITATQAPVRVATDIRSWALPALLCVALWQTACASLLGLPTYYDATTFKNLTDLKAEALLLYDTFAADPVDETKIASVRLKLAQAYEYEKGKGAKNTETQEQLDIVQQMFGRHVNDRRTQDKWAAAHLANQKTNLGEAFDIAIATERLKNKNE